MGMTAAVIGGSGYGGGELLRLLLAHPEIEIGAVAAHSNAGEDIADVHPHLPDLAGRTFVDTAAAVASGAGLIFLALPHGRSAEVAATIPAGVKVVDLGADFRLANADEWARAYGVPHAGTWTYGMPELPGARAEIAAAERVAAPGCYPTAVSLAYAPLLAAGVIEPADLVTVAASGTSGAGRSAKVNLLGSEVMGDVTAYKVGRHQHGPEIVQNLGRVAGAPVTLSFTTTLAPMPRGILATCTARPSSKAGTDELGVGLAFDDELITGILRAFYADEPFVKVLPAGRWPRTSATLGSNTVHLQATFDEGAGRVVVISAIDNLTKGAAGQAIQCANLMLGLPETLGLPVTGLAP
ncbi:N-acetyl-gamma-glutamyl-phosphate reductase [Frankia sp. CNm7]|uniref:N-acetyl-gamma-glutamyl-phosphate reductase n=1 Tax=Frankia nepalensis TaxID=1836974 RepID=A0A937RCD0_9ACTN|nr:N-acetyl-gamma-glutamyl-phosphate reductase [Frankia nepalensis]MBL7501455.1 N-acetyl-gamma-glutamyl-phosphate reductase [Frankia nepalensis]MBL7513309.1 N-acetyl-gamma-glutamyl-phosphate reductase [Frankia nepalensis]MBL7522957.1 N-acetyl-gamma-glutamyl-phosphate reductase [Frankia nepalensis]MBL7626395.1 N-acetyl-gamma-glutamyl-phosphate reductase [Frankia nepalensis]